MTHLATVSLEILVAGVMACVWIVLFFVWLLVPSSEVQETLLTLVDSLSIGDFLLASVFVYGLGWVIHHLSEIIFDSLFQTRYRRELFSDEVFYKIRSTVFQYGSDSVAEDIRFDRHVLRISRSNVLNFSLIAIVSLLYLFINLKAAITTTVMALAFAIVSFSQWQSRYKGTYKKFQQIYNAIESHAGQKVPTKESHPVAKCISKGGSTNASRQGKSADGSRRRSR